MDPKDEARRGEQRHEGGERAPARQDVGGEASARQQEIGPSGGPPDEAERQWRGAAPTEDVLERTMREGSPPARAPGTGAQGELGEPDSGVASDPPDLE